MPVNTWDNGANIVFCLNCLLLLASRLTLSSDEAMTNYDPSASLAVYLSSQHQSLLWFLRHFLVYQPIDISHQTDPAALFLHDIRVMLNSSLVLVALTSLCMALYRVPRFSLNTNTMHSSITGETEQPGRSMKLPSSYPHCSQITPPHAIPCKRDRLVCTHLLKLPIQPTFNSRFLLSNNPHNRFCTSLSLSASKKVLILPKHSQSLLQ